MNTDITRCSFRYDTATAVFTVACMSLKAASCVAAKRRLITRFSLNPIPVSRQFSGYFQSVVYRFHPRIRCWDTCRHPLAGLYKYTRLVSFHERFHTLNCSTISLIQLVALRVYNSYDSFIFYNNAGSFAENIYWYSLFSLKKVSIFSLLLLF